MFKILVLVVLVTVVIDSDTVEGFRRRRKQDNTPSTHYVIKIKSCKSGGCSGSSSGSSSSSDSSDKSDRSHQSNQKSKKGGCHGNPCPIFPPPLPPQSSQQPSQQTTQQPTQQPSQQPTQQPTQQVPTNNSVTTPPNNNGGTTLPGGDQTTQPNNEATTSEGNPGQTTEAQVTNPVVTLPTAAPECNPNDILLNARILDTISLPVRTRIPNLFGNNIDGICVNLAALSDGQLLSLISSGALSGLINSLNSTLASLPANELVPIIRNLLNTTTGGTNPVNATITNLLNGVGNTLGGLTSGLTGGIGG